MGQERLNHLVVLHVHKELTDDLDLISIANEFVGDSEHRLKLFGTFSWTSYHLVLSIKQVIIWYFLLNKLSFDTFY